MQTTETSPTPKQESLIACDVESAAIPACYSGDDFKSPQELQIGQMVIHTHYGSPRVVKVAKRHKLSVTIEFEGRRYGCSLYELKRLPAAQ